jgi:hypothetical protein
VRRLLLLVGMLIGCSRTEPAVLQPEPSPVPVTAVPEETATATPPEATPSPSDPFETSVVEVRVVTRTPVDVGTIPNFDRPAEPTPGSPAERRAQCLTYTVERETFGESRRVKVRVRSTCPFWIPPEESWFEIEATPSSGQGVTGRARGNFQTPIAPHSSNVETFIEVDCPGDVRGGCKYYVTAQ